jgi:hypothetical protein
MSSVALAFVANDRSVGSELQTRLTSLGHELTLLPTESSVRAIFEQDGAVDAANVVVMIWSRNADYSDFMTAHATQASKQRKLLIVRTDSTQFPSHVSALVVELRGMGLDRAAFDAIRIAIAAVLADDLERSAESRPIRPEPDNTSSSD